MSFEAYGAVENITEDTFGYYIDFANKTPNETSVPEQAVVYRRQFSLTTSSTVL